MSDSNLSIDQLLDILAKADPASAFYRQAAAILNTHLVHKSGPKIQAATPRGAARKLTIGMATYDDFDGAYFSVQAIRLFHPEVLDDTEILVIDNHPEGPAGPELKHLEGYVKHFRYVPASFAQGTAVRDLLFREAAGEFVLCMDSHVLYAPGALAKLVRYIDAHPDSHDLWQGPLLSDKLEIIGTHFDPIWRGGMWGVWGCDPRALDSSSEPFEISMQGLGVFCCRRDAWPGLNPRLRGFGGEEGCLHEKFRQAGRRTLCLPFLQWLHRFPRPHGIPYAADWAGRIRNYLLLFEELGLDSAPMIEHFEQHIGVEATRAAIAAAEREFASPFQFFEAIYCINRPCETERWKKAEASFQELGIAGRVRRFPAIETPGNHHIGCALSHRAVLAEARQRGLRNVLVFEDDVTFRADAAEKLRPNLDELKQREWKTLYLGGHRWGRAFEKAPGCRHLEVPHGVTCVHAIAYHKSIYESILNQIPDSPAGVALWLRDNSSIHQYYARAFDGLHLLTSPSIAS